MSKYFSKEIFKEASAIFWPMVISLMFSSILNIVDNAMLSNYDELAVTGAATITQFRMAVGPIFFALLSGIGIFSAQYFGAKQYDNLKKTFGLSVTLGIIWSIFIFIILSTMGTRIVDLFVKENPIARSYGIEYLSIFKYSYLIFPINYAFTFSYRRIKKTKIPMIVNTIALFINTILNLIFIHGMFGIPAMGAGGAALATVIANYIAFILNVVITIKIKAPFIGSLNKMLSWNMNFITPIIKKTIPLIISETLFGFGRFTYMWLYSFLSVEAFAGAIIATTISSIMNSFVMATANTSGIIIGTSLGAIETEEDKQKVIESGNHLIGFMFSISVGILLVNIFILPIFINIFGLENELVIKAAIVIIQLDGIFLALRVFSSSILSLIRSGGDVLFSILIDSGLAWLVGIPITVLAVIFIKDLTVTELKIITLIESFAKAGVAMYRFKSFKWLNKVV